MALSNPAPRAGQYVRQPTGYRAFIPAPLPPQPPLVLGAELTGLLSEADRALGRLDGSVLTLPNPDLFILMYVRKEAVLSSQIEGTQSSLQDLLAAEASLYDENRPHDVEEVINYVRAMKHGLARLPELPVSVRLVREIHAELMQGVRGGRLHPGELRQSQNWIGPAGCTLNTAAFVPPPAHEVPNHLGEWEKFLHQDDGLPPLVRIALAHVQFETIHPFLDGNGRIGRLMIPLYLVSCGVLSKPSLYLSDFFERNQASYYDALMRVRTSHDLIHWVRFFLSGVAETARKGRDVFQGILQLRTEVERAAMTLGKRSANAREALNLLYRKPVVTAGQLVSGLGVSSPTANTLIREFERLGILRESTGRQKGRVYVFDRYLRLFVS